MTPRARRTAVIAASVPDDTSRTISTLGTRAQIASASSTSRSVDAPNDVPSAAARCTASTMAGCAWPRIDRAPRLHVVDVAVALGVDQVGALAAGDEERVPADGVERPHRRVHAAGDAGAGARVEIGHAVIGLAVIGLGGAHVPMVRSGCGPRPLTGSCCPPRVRGSPWLTSFEELGDFVGEVGEHEVGTGTLDGEEVFEARRPCRRSSRVPRAAFNIAYSPLTWYAATGTSNDARTAAITSR